MPSSSKLKLGGGTTSTRFLLKAQSFQIRKQVSSLKNEVSGKVQKFYSKVCQVKLKNHNLRSVCLWEIQRGLNMLKKIENMEFPNCQFIITCFLNITDNFLETTILMVIYFAKFIPVSN